MQRHLDGARSPQHAAAAIGPHTDGQPPSVALTKPVDPWGVVPLPPARALRSA